MFDVESRRWAVDLRIPLVWIETQGECGVDLALRPDRVNEKDLQLHRDVGKWKTSTDGGMTTSTIGHLLADLWNCGRLNRTPNVAHRYVHQQHGLRVLLGEDYWCPVDSLSILYRVQRRGWIGTFSFKECKGILNEGTGTITARLRIARRRARGPAHWLPRIFKSEASWLRLLAEMSARS